MEHYESFLSEASFLANLRHINITRVYCLAYQDNQPCIIAEWMKGDTLSDYLAKQTFVPFIEAKNVSTSSKSEMPFNTPMKKGIFTAILNHKRSFMIPMD